MYYNPGLRFNFGSGFFLNENVSLGLSKAIPEQAGFDKLNLTVFLSC